MKHIEMTFVLKSFPPEIDLENKTSAETVAAANRELAHLNGHVYTGTWSHLFRFMVTPYSGHGTPTC